MQRKRKIKASSSSSSSIVWSAAAETVANIEELLTQILLSVPARSVVRFKCVSKHWFSLISDPKFCERHTHQNPNPNISAFFSARTKQDYFECIPLGNHGNPSGNPFKTLNNSLHNDPSGLGLKILQSCNGLFLCIPCFADFTTKKNYPVYVVNPTTNKFLALSVPRAWENSLFVRYALAFDPSKSHHYKVVFLNMHQIHIYSSETQTWRLLEISFTSRKCRSNWDDRTRKSHHYKVVFLNMHQIHIYSSETQTWRLLEISFTSRKCRSNWDDRTRKEGVYFNGAIHRIRNELMRSGHISCEPGDEDGFMMKDNYLVHYYDIGEERMGLALPSPPVVLTDDSMFRECAQRNFGVSGGHLYLIDIYWETQEFDVMEMERDYSGWFVKYHVGLNLRVKAGSNSYFYALLLGLVKQDEQEEEHEGGSSVLLIPYDHPVLSYNLRKTKTRNKISKMAIELINKKRVLVLDDGHCYMETFFFAFAGCPPPVGKD